MGKKLDIRYRLVSVELMESTLNEFLDPINSNYLFHYEITLNHKVKPQDKLMRVDSIVNIKSENKDLLFGKIKTGCLFHVENFDEVFKVNDGEKPSKISIPKDLGKELATIALSTTRGIMFSTFKGTYLHSAILPLIDKNTLLPK